MGRLLLLIKHVFCLQDKIHISIIHPRSLHSLLPLSFTETSYRSQTQFISRSEIKKKRKYLCAQLIQALHIFINFKGKKYIIGQQTLAEQKREKQGQGEMVLSQCYYKQTPFFCKMGDTRVRALRHSSLKYPHDTLPVNESRTCTANLCS